METPVSTPDRAAPRDDGVLSPVTEYPAFRLREEAYPAAMGGRLGVPIKGAGANSAVGVRLGPGSSAWAEGAGSCARANAGTTKRRKTISSPLRIKSARPN